jgi:hypothetical protein
VQLFVLDLQRLWRSCVGADKWKAKLFSGHCRSRGPHAAGLTTRRP